MTDSEIRTLTAEIDGDKHRAESFQIEYDTEYEWVLQDDVEQAGGPVTNKETDPRFERELVSVIPSGEIVFLHAPVLPPEFDEVVLYRNDDRVATMEDVVTTEKGYVSDRTIIKFHAKKIERHDVE